MIYQGIFEDINGGKHLLRIGTSGDVVALKFGGSPFVTTMDESDGSIYMPVKCQAGTIGLVAVDTDYMFGLYTGDAHGMPVTLYRGEVVNPAAVEWVGYVSPSLYDIGYTKYLEALDVDCVDGLATLAEYKYKPIGNNAGIVSLLDLVRHCIAKCGCYTMMVLSTNTRLSSTDTRDLWQSCRISERNFMAQDSAATDGEDDKTYKEVLEAVCQWMGVTAIAQGDTVYFVDYDALPNNAANTSIVVDVAAGTVTTGTMVVAEYDIDGESYADAGSQLSLDNVYTKVTVTCDLNEYDDVLGDIFDGVENITADDATFKSSSGFSRVVGEYGTNSGEFDAGLVSGDDNMLIAPQTTVGGHDMVAVKYYKSPNITLHHYSGTQKTTAGIDSTNYTTTQSINGGWLCRMFVARLEKEISNQIGAYNIPITNRMDLLMMVNDIHNVTFDNYIILTNHASGHIPNASAASYPFIETNDNLPATALFGGNNAYLVISGDVLWHSYDSYMYPVPDGEIDIDNGRKTCPASDAYLLAKLQWGNQWWNGTNWRSTETTFRIPFQLSDERYDAVMFKALGFLDMTTWRIGTDAQGYLVKMPRIGSVIQQTVQYGGILAGLPKLTIYKPMDMGSDHATRFMAIRNLRMTPVIANPNGTDQDADTVYTNIIDIRNAAEMDEVSLTVCTWDNKTPNFSAVAYTDGDAMRYVDNTYNTALAAAEVGSIRHDGTVSDGHMRQEEHLVYRLTNQYSEPAKVLNITLHDAVAPHQMVYEGNLDTSFIVDKVDVDYRNQRYKYKLIEKR